MKRIRIWLLDIRIRAITRELHWIIEQRADLLRDLHRLEMKAASTRDRLNRLKEDYEV